MKILELMEIIFYTGCFFLTGPPPKSTDKLIYVNVDSPNFDFPYFNFSGEAQCKNTPYRYIL